MEAIVCPAKSTAKEESKFRCIIFRAQFFPLLSPSYNIGLRTAERGLDMLFQPHKIFIVPLQYESTFRTIVSAPHCSAYMITQPRTPVSLPVVSKCEKVPCLGVHMTSPPGGLIKTSFGPTPWASLQTGAMNHFRGSTPSSGGSRGRQGEGAEGRIQDFGQGGPAEFDPRGPWAKKSCSKLHDFLYDLEAGGSGQQPNLPFSAFVRDRGNLGGNWCWIWKQNVFFADFASKQWVEWNEPQIRCCPKSATEMKSCSFE